MKSRKKTGIIGFGLAGRNMHYRALVEGLGDLVEVTAVWNRSEIPREGRAPGDFPLDGSVAVYRDIDRFFAHPDMDVVHITTPSGQHLEYIERAALSGRHVICDKPLEVTLARIDRAIGVCEKNGVKLTVSFQHRYNPHVQRLKDVIEKGNLGEIIEGSTECKLYRNPEYYTGSSWHGIYSLDGGAALINQSIHYIDLLQWLMGAPVETVRKGIAERLVHTYIEAEDFGYGELALANGASMTILGGTCFRPGIGQSLEIKGTDGWASVTEGIVTRACWGGADKTASFGEAVRVSGSSSSPMLGLDNHVRCFRAAYEALLRGDDMPVSGHEARKSTEIILGIYKAAETDRPVALPLEADYKPGGAR
ncbi:Gfo/Idh/MocA family oxidoreductase [bacterium]|nr:Gfo/Idh/MocA family oxidoreductase [bacterium]